jgi:sugar phosphate isomerase/epimerase
MYKCLSAGAINVQTKTLEESLAAAKTGGFDGLEINVGDIADRIERSGADAVKKTFADAGIRPAAFGLPVEWRQDEDRWRADLNNLPRYAKAAAAIGVTRCATWVLPSSKERPLAENKMFHVERFKPIAQTLGQHGISLGLEFIGPKTLRDGQKFEFIYKMGDMLELGRQIGPNVGLLLDCWHWYTSHGTLNELKKLRPEQVVYVHVNDAPRGIEIDRQIDNVRELPGATGVIDIAGFLQALKQIGYDGPVTPEPFKKELADLPNNEARLKKVGAAMDDIFAKSGLATSATAVLSP